MRGKRPGDSHNDSRGSKGELEKDPLRSDEEDKEDKNKTDRRFNDQRGGSGMPFDAGTLDSPNSQANKNKQKEPTNGLEKKPGDRKSSKDELGWQKDDSKAQNEDEKHDENVSLLDVDNDKDLYSNEVIANKGKRDRNKEALNQNS